MENICYNVYSKLILLLLLHTKRAEVRFVVVVVVFYTGGGGRVDVRSVIDTVCKTCPLYCLIKDEQCQN